MWNPLKRMFSSNKSEEVATTPPPDALPAERIPATEANTERRVVLKLEGDNTFPLPVVGESKYQAELESICGGRTEEGANHLDEARLILDDENPYDRNAVRVEIRGTTVGFLDKEDAKKHRAVLQHLQQPRAQCICTAQIRGGWKRKRGKDQEHFGVWLDFPLGTASLSD